MNMIEHCAKLAGEMRLQHFAIDGEYRRGDKTWTVRLSPAKPETPGLDFDGQSMFLDAVEIILPVTQPPDCLQFVQEGRMVFTPRIGDLLRFTVGGLNTEYEIVERGDRPCWFFLFGNREIQVFAEKLRRVDTA